MNRKTLMTLAGLLGVALLAGFLWLGNGSRPAAHGGGSPVAAASPTGRAGQAPSNPSSLATVKESALPAEAQTTLALIAKGGPYPYSRDGINFGNFEGALPKKNGGYYQEYTVPTPGSNDRGARRIIVGSGHEKYYTADHYATFRFILEGR
ncbi:MULTISPECIES: ribonuclease domain-containing protein [Arthrobacter]|uniref:Ribonuclease domain-containing protein n=2 Tax=Arthrobacter TaxID=1663 RepID=A0ABU9KHI4_9MICC|nr:ribonuclease domain-containing protein [Arthrobacter sp. YJM1]MDP5226696.1 ribonuclease domain-containing protein [Arthrobacter sp. YJM1]